MSRLLPSLATPIGTVNYDLAFDRDELGVAYLQVHVDATLTLICQRTLDAFVLPVHINSRLGLITREEEEAGLSIGCEPLLVTQYGVRLLDVIEDELILALPLIPLQPGTEEVPGSVWSNSFEESGEEPRKNPFAILSALKKPTH